MCFRWRMSFRLWPSLPAYAYTLERFSFLRNHLYYLQAKYEIGHNRAVETSRSASETRVDIERWQSSGQ